jgi:exodeoxyribonuclease V
LSLEYRHIIDDILQRVGMSLTPDQAQAVETFFRYHRDEIGRAVLVIEGAAGTGKTFLIRLLTYFLLKQGYKVALLAPTGRAAKVITKRTKRYASTIHRYIYAPMETHAGSVNFSLKENKDPSKMYYIVDEASMVGDGGDEEAGSGLLADLLKFIFHEDIRRKVIMVGDPAQLPPVGSQTSPALDMDYLRKHYRMRVLGTQMKEVMRQAEFSEVLRYATEVRDSMETGIPPVIEKTWGGEVEHVDNGHEAMELYAGMFRAEDPDAVVFITYSNKLAVDVNLAVRRLLHEPEEDLIRGEQIMVVRNNYAWGEQQFPFIANGEMGFVRDVYRETYEEKYGFRWVDVLIEFQDLSNNAVEVHCKVVLDLLSDKKAQLSYADMQGVVRARRMEYENQPKTKAMDTMRKDPYINALQIKYGYAVTGHKAQGGQWRNVIIAFEPLYKGMSMHDYLRWAYTAITRAEDKLYVLGFPFAQTDY